MSRVCAIDAVLALVTVVWLPGCAGPGALRLNRTEYNRAMQETANQELLLNIVRLKYHEPIAILGVSGINATFKFDLVGALGFTNNSPSTNTQSLQGTYAEEPLINYVPMQGEEVAKRIMTDIDLNAVATLSNKGWSVSSLLKIVVKRLGALENNPEALVMQDAKALESYQGFCQLCRHLEDLQVRGDLSIRAEPDDHITEDKVVIRTKSDDPTITAALWKTAFDAAQQNYRLIHEDGTYTMVKPGDPVIRLEARYTDEEDDQAIKDIRLLGVDQEQAQAFVKNERGDNASWVLKLKFRRSRGLPNPPSVDGHEIAVDMQTNSFASAMYGLAFAVEVPESDASRVLSGWMKCHPGRTRVDLMTNPNWARGIPDESCRIDQQSDKCCPQQFYLTELLNVRFSPCSPQHVLVKVRHGRYWFYIDDDDTVSKDTFIELGYIFSMQTGEVKATGPVITIPTK